MLTTGTDRCDAIGDLIGDLMHLADSDGVDAVEQVRNGMLHYYAETHHERRPSRFSVEME